MLCVSVCVYVCVCVVPVLYKYGRKLVGDHTVKSRLLRVCISESQFADDLALYAVDRAIFESAGRKFVQVGSQWVQ